MKAREGKLKADNFPASLLLPMGKDGPAFLAYENFTAAYLLWNESLVYSTDGRLSRDPHRRSAQGQSGRAEVQVLSYDEIKELQTILVGKGYDVGEVDGKLGRATRAAVKDMQLKLNWRGRFLSDASLPGSPAPGLIIRAGAPRWDRGAPRGVPGSIRRPRR